MVIGTSETRLRRIALIGREDRVKIVGSGGDPAAVPLQRPIGHCEIGRIDEHAVITQEVIVIEQLHLVIGQGLERR